MAYPPPCPSRLGRRSNAMIQAPHVTGSATSEAAAEAIRPSAANLREVVQRAIISAGLRGLTDEEGIATTGLNPSTYRPRRIDLQRVGALVDLGERRATASGRAAVVWFAVGAR